MDKEQEKEFKFGLISQPMLDIGKKGFLMVQEYFKTKDKSNSLENGKMENK